LLSNAVIKKGEVKNGPIDEKKKEVDRLKGGKGSTSRRASATHCRERARRALHVFSEEKKSDEQTFLAEKERREGERRGEREKRGKRVEEKSSFPHISGGRQGYLSSTTKRGTILVQ